VTPCGAIGDVSGTVGDGCTRVCELSNAVGRLSTLPIEALTLTPFSVTRRTCFIANASL
jgi:hypothetical protein